MKAKKFERFENNTKENPISEEELLKQIKSNCKEYLQLLVDGNYVPFTRTLSLEKNSTFSIFEPEDVSSRTVCSLGNPEPEVYLIPFDGFGFQSQIEDKKFMVNYKKLISSPRGLKTFKGKEIFLIGKCFGIKASYMDGILSKILN